MIKLELTNEQATFWRACMDNQDSIDSLLKNKAFDMKRGKVEMNFDKTGKLSSIVKTTNIQLHT